MENSKVITRIMSVLFLLLKINYEVCVICFAIFSSFIYSSYLWSILNLADPYSSSPQSGSPLSGKLFVVIGAGGAGKALAYGAKEKGAKVVIANRTYG